MGTPATLQSVRAHIASRCYPHLGGKRPFSIPVQSQSHDEATQPAQSIVSFDIRRGNDLEDAAQALGRLWAATREYLKSIPGLEKFKFAKSSSNPCAYCLLLLWTSDVGWKRFQSSLGLGLLLRLLDGQVSNACTRGIAALGEPGQEFELIAFKFNSLSGSDRDDFERSWCSLAELHSDPGLIVQGNWIEENSTSGMSQAVREDPKVFLVIITSTQHTDITSSSTSLFDSTIEDLLLKADLGVAREKFRMLESESFKEKPMQCFDEQFLLSSVQMRETQIDTLSELMKLMPIRIYSESLIEPGQGRLPMKESLEDSQESQIKYEPPRFIFKAIGEIRSWTSFQRGEPPLTLQLRGIVELISFEHNGLEGVEAAFEDLCQELSKLIYFKWRGVKGHLYRFQEESKQTDLTLLIRWVISDIDDRIANRPPAFARKVYQSPRVPFQQLHKERMIEVMSVVDKFTAQHYLSYNTTSFPNYGSDSFWPSSTLEITTFNVNVTDIALFDTAFASYHQTFSSVYNRVQFSTWVPKNTCDGSFHGGWENSTKLESDVVHTETENFVAVIAWKDTQSRKRWYGEYIERFKIYEAFGSKIDSLQLLVTKSPVTRLFKLQKAYEVKETLGTA